MIEARGLTKRYGTTTAVDDLWFTVEPGRITGFLGPNGAGKTTTMRLILGLDRPTAGSVTVNGKPFAQLAYPMREVGALLEAKAVHGGRSAYNHLLCLAAGVHGTDRSQRRVPRGPSAGSAGQPAGSHRKRDLRSAICQPRRLLGPVTA
jgi:ABC-type multidrug transport system ATPase subunit